MYDIQKFRDALDLIDKDFGPAAGRYIIYLLTQEIGRFVVSQLQFRIEKVNRQIEPLIMKKSALAHLSRTKKEKTGFRQSVLQVSFEHSC